jgi:hypothetical protein
VEILFRLPIVIVLRPKMAPVKSSRQFGCFCTTHTVFTHTNTLIDDKAAADETRLRAVTTAAVPPPDAADATRMRAITTIDATNNNNNNNNNNIDDDTIQRSTATDQHHKQQRVAALASNASTRPRAVTPLDVEHPVSGSYVGVASDESLVVAPPPFRAIDDDDAYSSDSQSELPPLPPFDPNIDVL